ncbi:hypothetical protein BD413DRAFT_580092 [Trametes elegans]|nr:hypothetical protein BD413DRAFT_580092 [Trametes elegans]
MLSLLYLHKIGTWQGCDRRASSRYYLRNSARIYRCESVRAEAPRAKHDHVLASSRPPQPHETSGRSKRRETGVGNALSCASSTVHTLVGLLRRAPHACRSTGGVRSSGASTPIRQAPLQMRDVRSYVRLTGWQRVSTQEQLSRPAFAARGIDADGAARELQEAEGGEEELGRCVVGT